MRAKGILQACYNAQRQSSGAFKAGAGYARLTTATPGPDFPALQQQSVTSGLRTCRGFRDAVGSTALLMLKSASDETGCTIWGKCEFLNPGGSVKDRPAVYMLKEAEEYGILTAGAWVVEASAGNTAIALTLAAKERNYRVICVMPDTQTEEKKRMLRVLGAVVLPVPIQKVSHPNHYTRVAERLAQRLGGFYCGQFDNTANRKAHFDTTGPEIWSQVAGKIDGFICAAGTGGTLAGVASSLRMHRRQHQGISAPIGKEGEYLRGSAEHSLACTDMPILQSHVTALGGTEKSAGNGGHVAAAAKPPTTAAALKDRLAQIRARGGPIIGLADIRGAGLFCLYTTGTLKAEGSSIVENIGQNRVTGNLKGFYPDFACEISDEEALSWTHRLLQEVVAIPNAFVCGHYSPEGLPLGMTSGVNVAGAVRLARAMGPGHHIVTILCDYGHLYSTKQWNPSFLRSLSLPEPTWIDASVDPRVLAALKYSFVPTNELSPA